MGERIVEVLVLTLMLAVVHASPVDYAGYQVVSVDLHGAEDQAVAVDLLDQEHWTELTDVWREGQYGESSLDLMLHGNHTASLVQQLADRGLQAAIKIPDVQSLVAEERPKRSIKQTWFSLDEYNSYDDIDLFLTDVSSVCARDMPSKLACSVVHVGDSWEGREIKLVRLGRPEGSSQDRPAVIIDAGIHAREWISIAVALQIIDKMVSGAATNSRSAVRTMLRAADWYILPLLNPDGYQYSRDKDRMWRKTRSIRADGRYRNCVGVDANRNWSYKWGGAGSSSKCLSNQYRGPHPFSEPETSAWAKYMQNIPGKKLVYITVHSYGQFLIHPWGHKPSRSPDFQDQALLLRAMGRKMERVDNKYYKVGLGPKMMGVTSGVSDDWAYANQSIKYSHTLELRDTGKFGFLLPKSKIGVTSEELFAGLKQMIKTLRNRREI